MQYSFIHIKKGRNQAVFVLENTDEGINKWIGPNMEEIQTYKGFIIRTKGLERDINFPSSEYQNIMKSHLVFSFSTFVNLSNPTLIYSPLNFEIKKRKDLNSVSCRNEVKYVRKLKNLRKKTLDRYCVDASGIISESLQSINPLDEPLQIKFYFKY